MLINPSPLVERIIGAAINVHKETGPGLLESTYDACFTHELMSEGLEIQKQVPIPVVNFNVTRLIDGVKNFLM